jgi:hypothetical protein
MYPYQLYVWRNSVREISDKIITGEYDCGKNGKERVDPKRLFTFFGVGGVGDVPGREGLV